MEILFVFRHGFKEFYDHRKCDGSGYDIRDGLGYLESGESKESVHDTEDGNENESASDHGQEGSTAIFSNALEEHVSIEGKWHEEEGDALDTQGGNTDGKDCRVITEHALDGGRAGYSDKGGNAHYHETAFDAEPESIPDAFVFSCTIVKGADRLEALSYTKGYAEKEVYDPCDNAHGCNGGISVGSGTTVEDHDGNTVEALAHQAWEAGCQDVGHIAELPGDVADV